MMIIVKFSLSIAMAIMCFACGQKENLPPSGFFKEDDWSVSGKITAKSFVNGEVIAIGMDGNRYYSHIDEDAKFIINLPANVIYALYFIPSLKPKETAHDFIHYLANDNYHEALLCFEESKDIGLSKTLRLPKIITNSYLDLGEIDIKESYAFPTKNPALALDFDNDGINDFNDLDDQNDGLSDKQQKILLERVDICHLGDDGSKTENISLEELYEHMKHGDGFGTCIAKAIKESLPSPNNDETKHVTDNSDKAKAHIPNEAKDHQDNVIEITPEAEGEPNASHDHKKPKNKVENNEEAEDDKPKKDQKKAKEDNKDNPNKK